MKKFLLIVSLLLSMTSLELSAQSCFNVSAGNDTIINCTQSCMDLKAKIPDVRTTDTYQVVPIPYTPYPYINATGVEFNPVYQDDLYSSVINLPFTFCFYGQNYTKCVVGTNGILTFDLVNANTYNAYIIDRPIPYAGGAPNNPGPYYPRASIMGPYHDIDPELLLQPWNRKMEYIIVGTAPCRKFILNFYRIPYFGCSDTINTTTQQMVLYEGTGIIDIFIQNKPLACNTTTNDGRAILGVQNWAQDQHVAVAGRNNSIWSASREGWRFVPSGPVSLLNRVELYKNGTLISTGTTTPLGNGELEALFPNICQSEDSMSYVVRAFYQKCDDPAVITEGSDTVIVYKSLGPLITDIIDAPCNSSLGKITVTSLIGPTYEYSIDGGVTWQASPVFNVPAGSYTITARLIGSPCTSTQTVIIAQPVVLSSLVSTVNSTCPGNDGVITVTASGGTAPYQYSINNGINYQASNIFPGLPAGNYNNIVIKDANGCFKNTSAVIVLDDTMRLELGTDPTICVGSSITLLPQTNPQTDIFKWTPATGLNYDTAKNPIAKPNDTTRYILTAKWGICQRKDTVTINVLHKPVPYAGKDTSVCYKTNAFLVGSATNLSGTVNYAWSPADSLNTPNAPTTIARIDTTRKFILTVTDNYGCNFSVTDSMWVTMMPPLNVFAGNDTNALLGKPHQLQASGGTRYVWSPVTSLNNPFIANPLATLFADTYFTVTVTDAIGCTDDDDVFIKVYEGPTYYLPNAFSPNGDGLNVVFRPVPVGIRSTEYFRIFNRYGEPLFETRQWMKGWDGTIKGKLADGGTYVWMIKGVDKNGQVVEMRGTFILVR